MPSSRHNGASKVLLILSIAFILLPTLETANTINLLDLPLKIPSASVNLHATLTDTNGLSRYFIQESISASGSTIKGKIVISSEKGSYSVHYNTGSDFNNKRLVIHGTNCLSFDFKTHWDSKLLPFQLPGLSKPVTNLVLLMGPSMLYRFDHSSLVWKRAADKNIRGTMMKGATTKINDELKITYYYKNNFDDETGIKNPSRIEFSGYDPYSIAYSAKENLILDIYLQQENNDDQLVNEVQPLPGIGCTNYLSTPETEFPTLTTDYVHYIMHELIQGATTTRTFSEIHASAMREILRLKATLLGITTEAIYDYRLGVSYLFQEQGSCNILPADLNAPGVTFGYFSLPSLFLVEQADYRYLGKLNFEHRTGFPVDAWEAVRFNATINGKKADKAVITQYFVKSRDSKIFSGHTLVSTTIAVYKLDSSKKTYTLTEGITRDYMNFEEAGFEDELHDIFSLKECKYLTSDAKVTFGFRLQCQDGSSYCTQMTERQIYKFKEDFVDFFLVPQQISPLRIDDVQYNLKDDQIEMDVTFLDGPNLQYIFNSKVMSVSAETFKKMKKVGASNEYECMERLAKYQASIIVVIYRPSDYFCGYLSDFDDLKEDTKINQPCSVYHFPLNNLHRIYQEIPIDKIQNNFLQFIGRSYSLFNGDHLKLYKLIDVIDKTKNQEASTRALQFLSRVETKLNSNDQTTVSLPDVKTFADCYQNCHDLEQLECITFSFCRNGDSVDCRVSSLSNQELETEHVEKDKTCSIYSLNALNDYSKVRNRKFKIQTSTAMDKSLDACAQSCHASPDCYSFQFCDYSCSFGGFYTDTATEVDEECSVFHPKVSQKYQKTGNKIVSEQIHTEMNLNFEQCASLCHGWSDGDTGCKSFNYCPKSRTESSCSLTQFSVKSPNTKTREGGECSNYELKIESSGKSNKESSSIEVIKGTSGPGAFGIIMLFLFVGALLGFAAPLAYTKVKQIRNISGTSESFTWTRQLDEPAENTN